MKNTKLYSLFNGFSTWELKHLGQFLHSPFFNRRQDTIKLLEYMEQEQKRTKRDWSKKAAYAQVYPGALYDDQKMRLLISRLFQLMEDFLVSREVQRNTVFKKIQLAKAYHKLNKEQAFDKAIRDAKSHLKKQNLRNANYHWWEYEIEFEYYDFINSKTRVKETNLQEMTDSFDTFFIANKLKLGCLLKAHQMVFKKEYEIGLLEEVLKFVQLHPSVLKSPAIAIYYHCYLSFTEIEKEESFLQLRRLMQAHQEAFPEGEIRAIYLLAINFCIRQLNTGAQRFIKEGFEMYRSGIQIGVLFEQGQLSKFTFNNIISLGIFLKEFQWLEEFIQDYKNKLPFKYRDNIVNFNLAKLHYEQKNFKKAMLLLARFDSEDYLLTLGAKTLLLKMYYELKELETLESLLESMRIYLQRKEVLSYHKKHFEDIVSAVKKLIDLPPYDKEAKEALRIQILAVKIPSEREWLLKQL